MTYFQFDSNIRVLYVFLGFLKNTWKYFFLSTFEKYSYFVCHYYELVHYDMMMIMMFSIDFFSFIEDLLGLFLKIIWQK